MQAPLGTGTTTYKPLMLQGAAGAGAGVGGVKPKQSPTAAAYRPTNPGWGAGSSQLPPSAYANASAGGGGGTGGVQNPPTNPYDVSGDPVLQQVLGNNVRFLGNAATQKTEDQRKTLLGYGSVELARKLFGNDPAFLDSVKNNPFSVLAQIEHQFNGPGGTFWTANNDLNKQNLFFSGHRLGRVLPEITRDRQGQEYNANIDVQNALDTISRSYLTAQQQAAQDEIAARQSAADRATQAALASGYGPGAANTENSVNSGGPTVPYVPPSAQRTYELGQIKNMGF